MSPSTGGVESPPVSEVAGEQGLAGDGLDPQREVHWNLSPAELYEQALARGEGRIAHMGAFAAVTAPHTGRSPNDKFTVNESATEKSVDWGKVNVAMDPPAFARLRSDVTEYLNGQDLFVRDCRAGADEAYGINVRVISTSVCLASKKPRAFSRNRPVPAIRATVKTSSNAALAARCGMYWALAVGSERCTGVCGCGGAVGGGASDGGGTGSAMFAF